MLQKGNNIVNNPAIVSANRAKKGKGLGNPIPKKGSTQSNASRMMHNSGPVNVPGNSARNAMPQLRGLRKNIDAHPNSVPLNSGTATLPQLRGLGKNDNASPNIACPISNPASQGLVYHQQQEQQPHQGPPVGQEHGASEHHHQGLSEPPLTEDAHSVSEAGQFQPPVMDSGSQIGLDSDGIVAATNNLPQNQLTTAAVGDSSLAVAQPVQEDIEAIMTEAQEIDPQRKLIKEKRETRCGWIFFGIISVSMVVLSLSLGFGLSKKKKNDANNELIIQPTSTPSTAPTGLPSLAPTGVLGAFLGSLPDYTQENLKDHLSPQVRASVWLENHPNISTLELWRMKQLFGLVTFYYSFHGEYWPKGLSEDWLDYDRNECEWWSYVYGRYNSSNYIDHTRGCTTLTEEDGFLFNRCRDGNSTCDRNGHFVKLDIGVIGALEGSTGSPSIPPEISLLSDLESIDIFDHSFSGNLTDLLPVELAELSNLKKITIQNENLGASIPSTLGVLTQLTELNLWSMRFEGKLPSEIGLMTSLQSLYFFPPRADQEARLTGTIPSTFGNLAHLKSLSLPYSHLSGNIPSELGRLTELEWMNLRSNSLTGTVPTALSNLRNLTSLNLINNRFTGTIPSLLFYLPALKALYLRGNVLESSLVVPGPEPSIANHSTLSHTGADGCSIITQLRPLELVFRAPGIASAEHAFDQTFEIVTMIVTGPNLILQGVDGLRVTTNFGPFFLDLTDNLKAQEETLAEGNSGSTLFTTQLDLLRGNGIQQFNFLITTGALMKNESTAEESYCRSAYLHTAEGGIPVRSQADDIDQDEDESPTVIVPSTTLPPNPGATTSPTQSQLPTQSPSLSTSSTPTQSQFPTYDNIRSVVAPVALEGGAEWADLESYQAKAIMWLETDPFSAGLSQARIQQRYALACIYYATYAVQTTYTVAEPHGWINSTGWIGNGDECSWFGLVCNEASQVEKIVLAFNRITGSFPAEIKIMAGSLTYIDIFGNSVYNAGNEGNAWLGDLVNLRHLFFGQTNFEYHGIPPHIGKLTNLIEFDCSYTLYSGPLVGSTFAKLQNLEYLVLSGNAYNSSIPIEIGQLPNLKFLYVQDALVEGDLSFMQPMQSIVECWIDKNPGLGGNIPTFIGEIQSLQSWGINGCGLTGRIPSELGNLKNMVRLWLDGNMLTGTVPVELGNLFSLEILEIEENLLTGTMPEDICLNRIPSGMLATLEADCAGNPPEISCDCCTCCANLS